MTIKFYCSCGKRLRAREEMAAMRTVCPACGNLVGVPSQKPTQRGTRSEPLSPQERKSRKKTETVCAGGVSTQDGGLRQESDERSVDPVLVQKTGRLDTLPPDSEIHVKKAPPKRPRRGRSWSLETRWHHCLVYPLRALPLVLGLALVLACCTEGIVLLWPELAEPLAERPWLWALFGLFPFVIVGYTCAYLQCVLSSALAGEAGQVRWPGGDLFLILPSTLTGVVCFLAGPVFPAVAAYFFWFEGGDPTFADWLIIAELAFVAVAHWLYTFLAVSLRGRLRDANPVRVMELIHKLGLPAVRIVVIASVLALVHALLGLEAVEMLQRQSGSSFLLLITCWVSALFFATFVLRWLGLCCFHLQKEK